MSPSTLPNGKSAHRVTFRPAVDVAWQKQLRDRHASEGVPPVPHLDVKRAIVRPVSRRLAEQVILKYEWLGTMANTSLHFGLFFGNFCAGVTCVGGSECTAGPYTHRTFGIARDELLILARGACVHWAPPGSNSRLVSWTCRLLAKEGRGKVLLAYSDTDAGEIGTIYQACNWSYIGRGIGRHWELVAPNGRSLNEQNINAWAKRAGMTYADYTDMLLRSGWRRQKPNTKHRYAYVLDRSDAALVARVEAMRRPYPKRAGSIGSDASGFQPGEGGAHPTPALQHSAEA